MQYWRCGRTEGDGRQKGVNSIALGSPLCQRTKRGRMHGGEGRGKGGTHRYKSGINLPSGFHSVQPTMSFSDTVPLSCRLQTSCWQRYWRKICSPPTTLWMTWWPPPWPTWPTSESAVPMWLRAGQQRGTLNGRRKVMSMKKRYRWQCCACEICVGLVSVVWCAALLWSEMQAVICDSAWQTKNDRRCYWRLWACHHYVPLVEFMCLAFAHMQGDNYCKGFRSVLLYPLYI